MKIYGIPPEKCVKQTDIQIERVFIELLAAAKILVYMELFWLYDLVIMLL